MKVRKFALIVSDPQEPQEPVVKLKVQGECNLHGKTKYLNVKKFRIAACLKCYERGYFHDAVAKEIKYQLDHMDSKVEPDKGDFLSDLGYS